MQTNKSALRDQLRKNRNTLDASTHQFLSITICEMCVASQPFQTSQHIACYLPNDGEVDTRLLIETLWETGKTCYLPVIDTKSKTLTFAPYTKDCEMQPNQYGILEPSSKPVHTSTLELIIAPLVGFDKQLHRLGMGGGFYDKTLAACEKKKPTFIGLGFQCQAVSTLPVEPHDNKLDAVFTA